jgi:hypothetical protein
MVLWGTQVSKRVEAGQSLQVAVEASSEKI